MPGKVNIYNKGFLLTQNQIDILLIINQSIYKKGRPGLRSKVDQVYLDLVEIDLGHPTPAILYGKRKLQSSLSFPERVRGVTGTDFLKAIPENRLFSKFGKNVSICVF